MDQSFRMPESNTRGFKGYSVKVIYEFMRIYSKNSYNFIRKWFLLNPFGDLGFLERAAKRCKTFKFQNFWECPLYEIQEYAFKTTYLNLINCCCGNNNFLYRSWWLFCILEKSRWKTIGKIHWFLHMNVHDNQRQSWRVNHKEMIGHLHNRFEEKNVKKSIQNSS